MAREKDQVRFLKCIAEPTRLRILKQLAGGEKYVGEIISALNKDQSLISHHLKALKECNVITPTQKARRVYYRLSDTRLAGLITTIETIMKDALISKESILQ